MSCGNGAGEHQYAGYYSNAGSHPCGEAEPVEELTDGFERIAHPDNGNIWKVVGDGTFDVLF